MKSSSRIFAVILLAALAGSCGRVAKEPSLEKGDWPQFLADAGRTGYTPAGLADNSPLSLRWKHENPAPTPAWMGVHTRMTFDFAPQPVVSGETLFYAGSTDCKIYAIDAPTGKDRWTFFAGAPVRFAPALWKDRLFAVSDDGFIYCLKASNGSVIWKKRGGKDARMVIGNDRMVSRWPVRGGAAVKDDILYVGAGIWPTEGIYIYALDPMTGDTLWVNDTSGSIEIDQPHGGARAKSGISSQGYLLAAENRLFVPTGRAIPAIFDLKSGELASFKLQKYRTYGGSRAMAADGHLFTVSGNTNDGREIIGGSSAVFSSETGDLAVRGDIPSSALAATPDRIYFVDSRDGCLKAYARSAFIEEKDVVDRRGETVRQGFLSTPVLSIPTGQPDAVSLVIAGKYAVVGTVNNKITVINIDSAIVEGTFDVDGVPYGLAAAHGRLFASTDRGSIFCFDTGNTKKSEVVALQYENDPFGGNNTYAKAAQTILDKTGVKEGWCLDAECGDGRLAFELARRTNLYIVACDTDPGKVAKARKALDSAGLYGSRVIVHEGTLADLGYPDYFADLIVSGRSVKDAAFKPEEKEIARLQKPNGGVVCLGGPDNPTVAVRGGLEGAGEWKHLYHDASNTIASEDDLVREDLEVLWYKDDRFDVPSRHGRGIGPLYTEGKLFVQGLDAVRCYDAYNGRIIWEYATPAIQSMNDYDHALGTSLTHQNWCIDNGRLYIRLELGLGTSDGRTVVALDAATGNELKRYTVPAIPDIKFTPYWGYLAVVDGVIYGSVANYEHIVNWGWGTYDTHKLFGESVALFAMNAETGDIQWTYRAKNSIRHNAIAIGGDRVYLIDRPAAEMDKNMLRPSGYKPSDHPSGFLVSLDAKTGALAYREPRNIYGTLLALSVEHDVLVMTYQYIRFGLSSDFGGKMTGFRASTGRRLWDVDTNIGFAGDQSYQYSSRPIINGDTIYLEPWAWDLQTGKKLDFRFEHSYTCGIVAGAKHMLVYRSATLGYLDLDNPEEGTQNYGGIRPGCWLNAIPAGGLVLMPDATDRCSCSYLIKATIALKPVDRQID